MTSALCDQPAATPDYNHTPPIVVLSFNRPHYLAETLESLRSQIPSLDERRIHLFQDGAVNAYSGIRYGDMRDISRCIAMFCKFFPQAHVHYSGRNIGICENFLRAERFVFETLAAPIAYFFEDDLVLSRKYVETLDALRVSFRMQPEIGCFNALGMHLAPQADQERNKSKLITMGQRWGFAMTKSHWIDIQPLLGPYYRMVCHRDYRQRPHDQIRAWYDTWVEGETVTSQDRAKDLVALRLGRWQASTYVCLARYIGEVGTHSTSENFSRRGFAATQIYEGHIPRRFPITLQQVKFQIAEGKRRLRQPRNPA